MTRYIKANPKVAQYLHLENDRNQVKDGNYLLWQADMLAFGRFTELPQILERIGGILLAAHEARQEQDGKVSRELPTATDERFVIEKDGAPESVGAAEYTQLEATMERSGNPDTGKPDRTHTVESAAKTVRTGKNRKTVKITNEETEA